MPNDGTAYSDEELSRVLDASAPAVVPHSDELVSDLDRAVSEARVHVLSDRVRVRGGARRGLVALGLAVLLVGGGATAAVATGGFSWLPWAQNPDVAYSFTLPSGRACEERVVLERTWFGGDWEAFVDSAKNLVVSSAEVDRTLAEIRVPGTAIMVLDARGELVSPGESGNSFAQATDDDWYVQAHKVALGREMSRLAQSTDLGDSWNSHFQLQCESVAP